MRKEEREWKLKNQRRKREIKKGEINREKGSKERDKLKEEGKCRNRDERETEKKKKNGDKIANIKTDRQLLNSAERGQTSLHSTL